MSGRPFLTARWRHLLLLNYQVDPGLLEPLAPSGTDAFNFPGKFHSGNISRCSGRCRVSPAPLQQVCAVQS